MLDKVFLITGNKVSSLITDENSLKFSSATAESVQSFKEAFAKKLSLSTKLEIKYDSIKHIRKEDGDKDVIILYKKALGIPMDCEFSFKDSADYDTFFTFFEKEKSFIKSHEALKPLLAIRNYGIGLIVTLVVTVFSYYQALAITDGTAEEAHSGKARLFFHVVELLGDKGVLAIGGLLSCFLAYKVWTRFSNPPTQIKLTPRNL